MLLLCIASGYYLLLWTNSLYDVLAVLPFKCFVNKQLLLLLCLYILAYFLVNPRSSLIIVMIMIDMIAGIVTTEYS